MRLIWKSIHRVLWILLAVPILLLPMLARMAWAAGGETPEFRRAGADGAVTVRILEAEGHIEEQNLEDYLVGAVLGEIPADFEEEALKAQAVAARTYTRKTMVTGGKHGGGLLCREAGCCQAYWDPEDFLAGGGSPQELETLRWAVWETDDQVLTYDGELIEATFFSCSGGRTEDAVAVWGRVYPYLRATDSPGEEEARYFRDSRSFSRQELEAALGITLPRDPDDWLGETVYTSGGGVETWTIAGKAFTGVEVRKRLGLRSAAFRAKVEGDGLTFETRGYGHRVGLSQYGAQAMAQAGKSYGEILLHYYPGTEMVKYVEKFTNE